MPKTRNGIKSFVLDRNRRPHWYRKGTRVAVVGTDINVDALNRVPGASAAFDHRRERSFGFQVGDACAAAVNVWIGEFGPRPDVEELCLFVTFTSFEVLVEVSDAMKWDEVPERGHAGGRRVVDRVQDQL